MATKSKKPSGLQITRNKSYFICKWKQGEKYSDGQEFQWRLSTSSRTKNKWHKDKVLKSATSNKISISKSDFYPNTKTKLRGFYFKVRGNGDKKVKKKGTHTWSSFVTSKMYALKAPTKPKVTFEADYTNSNAGTFSWELDTSDTDSKMFTDVEWQSILTSSTATGSRLSWSKSNSGWITGTGSSSGSKEIVEDLESITSPKVRWLRARSRGPYGASDWVYASHAYAKAPAATNVNATAVYENGAISVSVSWQVSADRRTPIDSMAVQYCIATPASDCKAPADASWNDLDHFDYSGSKGRADFQIDGGVEEDEVLFIRVTTSHDGKETYSPAVAALVGKLKAPEFGNVDVNTTTNSATIEATNNSEVPDSKIVVTFVTSTGYSAVVGEIPHGSTSVKVSLPTLSQYKTYGFTIHAETEYQRSSVVSQGGAVPVAPEWVTVSPVEGESGTVRVSWPWTWEEATSATISWSDNRYAWESTSQPSTYDVDSKNVGSWNVSGIESGKTYYFRVRLNAGEDVKGPWSEITSESTIDLTATPETPTLILSDDVITEKGTVTASWAFTSEDGSSQAYAELCEATVSGDGITYGRIIARVRSEQSAVLSAQDLGWVAGNTYDIAVRVTSSTGATSAGWSAVASVTIADEITAKMTSNGSDNYFVSYGDGSDDDPVRWALFALPLGIHIDGGDGCKTTLTIERAEDYHVTRPDGTVRDGYEGETIYTASQDSDPNYIVTLGDLMRPLDDGARYVAIATVIDGYGQVATDALIFEVDWQVKSTIPAATITSDPETLSVSITPTADDVKDGDTCDIYRLSLDAPELIVSDGSFGTTYVDPYPAFGEGCGHRIVHKSAYGDYITEDNLPAWLDTDEDDTDQIMEPSIVIDYDDNRVILPYDIKIDNSWSKDFERTVYLGGSVEGDWNPAVTRDVSASTNILTSDIDEIKSMRALANYTGICHVRTPEGSSFAADVQVQESRATQNKLAEFSLTIKRVDPVGFDGLTLDDWNRLNGIVTEGGDS
jgi:hypothetical protein